MCIFLLLPFERRWRALRGSLVQLMLGPCQLCSLVMCVQCTLYTLHSVYNIYIKWPMCTFYQTFEVDNASIQCCVHNLLMVQCPWYAGTPCTVDWCTSPGAPFTGSLFSPHMTDCEHINTLIHVTWNTECLKVHEKLHII